MKFNEKVVKLRKLKGLTQDEFASAVGVSRQAVYKWESGQSYPEVPKLLEMKILFDISIDDLLDENYVVELPEKAKRKRVSREKKAEIEASVKEEITPPTASEEVIKEEPAVVAAAPAPVAEETVNTAPEKEEPVSEEALSTEKKRGFFGRLFGRK